MKTKRLVAALLVIMMIAALLPFGAMAEEVTMAAAELHTDRLSALSEEVSVDKVSSLRDGIYVSVNGQAFTDIDQTIKCGSGTAKLTVRFGDQLVLLLNNATINKAELLGTADGVTYYAGIVVTYENLVIETSGKCSITAPAASSASKFYEGIYAEGNLNVVGSGLTISGFTLAAEASNHLRIENCTVSKCEEGVYAPNINLNGGNSINATGSSAVFADEELFVYGTNTVTLSADGTDSKIAAMADWVNIYEDAILNVTANMNTKNLLSDEEHSVCALVANSLLLNLGKINATTNLQDNGSAYACAVSIGGLNMGDNSDLKATVNVKGEAFGALAARVYSAQVYGGTIEAKVTGAASEDIALSVEGGEISGNTRVYASTDNKAPVYGAVVFDNEPFTDSLKISGNIIRPDEANVSKIEEDGNTAYIVVDAEGNPASEVIISSKHPFKDVKSTDYFSDPVVWAFENNITNGTSATTFGPNAPCTRAQVVTFLWRAMGCPAVENAENPFTDVKEGQWYTDAVLWAVENGITNGTSKTTFSPNDKVTRAQTVTFLYRAAKGEPVDASNPFKDVKAGQYYTDAVLWAVANGITNGTSPVTFGPNTVCTRGQIVTFLYRFINN